MESGHKAWYMALTIVNVVVLIAVFFFNGAQALPGLFLHTVSNQSAKYSLDITPAGWTFSIWGFIYTWQALWVIYSLLLLCRKAPDGSPAYLSPALLFSPVFFVLYMCANACNIAWLFLFDRDQIEAAFASLLGIAVLLVLALCLSYRSLDRACPGLAQQNRTQDIWLVRGFVHNGLAIYATWTAIASLLNLAMVVRYRSSPEIGDATAATVALSVLSAEIVVFFIADLVFLDRYSRYTVTPYVVVVIALVGSITKNWESGAENSIFTAVLLGLGSAGLVAKVALSIYRHVRREPFPTHSAATVDGYKGGQLA